MRILTLRLLKLINTYLNWELPLVYCELLGKFTIILLIAAVSTTLTLII